jgi:uncharacterized protein YggE
MKRVVIVIAFSIAIALSAEAEPQITGTPEELAAHLRSMPGQVTLRGEAEVVVEADTAEIAVHVRNTDRSFKEALAENQRLRSEILAALEKDGIPAERIRMSRFSSTPTQGYFTGKVKSFEIESRVTVEAAREKEIQAVASLVDEKEEVSLRSLTFKHTEKDKHAADALAEALEKVQKLKGIYEEKLGVELVPKSVGAPSKRLLNYGSRYRPYAEASLSSGTDPWEEAFESAVVLHALEQRGPDVSQFDQVVYKANVTVTFEVFSAQEEQP